MSPFNLVNAAATGAAAWTTGATWTATSAVWAVRPAGATYRAAEIAVATKTAKASRTTETTTEATAKTTKTSTKSEETKAGAGGAGDIIGLAVSLAVLRASLSKFFGASSAFLFLLLLKLVKFGVFGGVLFVESLVAAQHFHRCGILTQFPHPFLKGT